MDILRAASAAAGSGLGAVFRGAGRLRRGRKSLHPRGRVGPGTLTISGVGEPLGVPLLDHAATHVCAVRLSRATGLPRPLPDILGLALRIEQEGSGPTDLLFASTGLGTLGRHVLVARRDHEDGPLTTLLPMRGPGGAVLLALVPTSRGRYDLRTSAPGSPWVTRGELLVHELGPDHEALRFDPVRWTPDGLRQYDVVRRLRAPSYRDADQASGQT